MQMTATARDHRQPTEIANMKIITNPKCWWGHGVTGALRVLPQRGVEIVTATLENRPAFAAQTEHVSQDRVHFCSKCPEPWAVPACLPLPTELTNTQSLCALLRPGCLSLLPFLLQPGRLFCFCISADPVFPCFWMLLHPRPLSSSIGDALLITQRSPGGPNYSQAQTPTKGAAVHLAKIISAQPEDP